MAKQKISILDAEGLGKRLKEARTLLRYSMREVNDKIHIPIASISAYEKGNPPTMTNFVLLAGFYISEIEERRLASFYTFEYFITGKTWFDKPQYFYISRSELAVLCAAGLIYSGVCHDPKVRKTRSGSYLGFVSEHADVLEKISQYYVMEMSSLALGLDSRKHSLVNNYLQDAIVALDMSGYYGDRIRINLNAGVPYSKVLEVLPEKYNEENFPQKQINRYFTTPSFDERVLAASSCRYGVLRADDVIFVSEDENMPSFSHF